MTRADVDAILARANAATAGPWDHEGPLVFERGFAPRSNFLGFCRQIANLSGSRGKYQAEEINADFIAAAREDVPALCAELLAAWDRIEELEGKR